MAAFLMHPVLHKSPFDPSAWPSPQAIEVAFQRQERQRLMFNVRPSDTAGQDFDQLIKCGLHLLQDSGIQAMLTQQCLLCHTLCDSMTTNNTTPCGACTDWNFSMRPAPSVVQTPTWRPAFARHCSIWLFF